MEPQLLRTNDCITEQINRFGDMIYRIGILFLRNRQDAEDAFQEVFLRLFEKAPAFASEEHEKAWLITVACNYCKNQLRLSWRRKNVPLEELPLLQADEGEIRVVTQLLSLPMKYRQVLYLHYYEGYSTEEIGALLHIKPATIRTQLKRGRELLKIELMGEIEHEESVQGI